MKYNDDDNKYTLFTGRTFYANNGIIGMDIFEKDEFGKWNFSLSEGYDGGVDCSKFLPSERIEIANFMIEQWCHYRYRAAQQGVQLTAFGAWIQWQFARINSFLHVSLARIGGN